MASGGYRPGAGRPKGALDKKPRKTKKKAKVVKTRKKSVKPDGNREKIGRLLDAGTLAKAKIYREFLERIATGERLSTQDKKLFAKLESELSDEIQDKEKPAPISTDKNIMPLDFMLGRMRDPEEDPQVRRQMAVAAAPYIHKKADEKLGKKDAQDDRAKKAASGKFRQSNAPLSVVK